MFNLKTILMVAALGATLAGCNCGGPPGADDGGAGGGTATGGGAATGGGGAPGGGGGSASGGGSATGGGSGAPSFPVVEFSNAAGRVSANSLTADVQLGLVPTRLRASGGSLSLEGSAVLLP